MMRYNALLNFRATLGRGDDEERKRRGEKQQARITFILPLARELFIFMGVPLPSCCRGGSPRILEERTTSSDSRTRGERSTSARYGLPSPPAPHPEIPSAPGGEKPRARLMALRGCHGYREPHGSNATAAPSESPFILEKHYKNAHGPHQGRYSTSLSLHPRCTGSHPRLPRRFPKRLGEKATLLRARNNADCRWTMVRKAAREVRNHEHPPPRRLLSRDFRRGDRFAFIISRQARG